MSKNDTIEFLNRKIHRELNHLSDNKITLVRNDVFELSKDHMKMTIGSLMDEEDGDGSKEFHVECISRKAGTGYSRKSLVLRNATDSVLEVLIIYTN